MRWNNDGSGRWGGRGVTDTAEEARRIAHGAGGKAQAPIELETGDPHAVAGTALQYQIVPVEDVLDVTQVEGKRAARTCASIGEIVGEYPVVAHEQVVQQIDHSLGARRGNPVNERGGAVHEGTVCALIGDL